MELTFEVTLDYGDDEDMEGRPTPDVAAVEATLWSGLAEAGFPEPLFVHARQL